jgi:hypothetical protein
MRLGEHRPFLRLVDAHFTRTISPAEEKELRQHLPACAPCQAYYERHLLFESLDPNAKGPEARLAVGLGLSQRRRPTQQFVLGATALAALALLPPLLGSALWHQHQHTMAARDGEALDPSAPFAARGASESNDAPHLMIYRLAPNHPPELVDGAIHRGDELAFAYTNPRGLERLMIFGIDEHRHVYWYHPFWSHEGENPVGLAVAAGPEVHELTEAVSQRLDGHTLRIVGLFTHDTISVKQVEQVVGHAPAGPIDFTRFFEGALPVEMALEIQE